MPATTADPSERALRDELRGLDRLELALPTRKSRARRVWSALWPKLAAVALALGIWELLYLSGWKNETIFPAPVTVFQTLFDNFSTIVDAASNTLQLAFVGFGLSIVLGTVIGAAVATVPV